MKTRLIRGDFEKDRGIEMIKKMNFGISEFHGHDFYELDIIIGGENSGKLNREELKVKRGDVIFLTPEDFHDYSEEGSLDIINIHFAEDFISKDLLLNIASGGKRYFSIDKESFSALVHLEYQ